jgi:integrase
MGSLVRKPNLKGEQVWMGRWTTDTNGRYHQVSLGPDHRVAARRLMDIIRKRDLALQGLAPEEGEDLLLAEIVAKYVEDLRTRKSERYAERVETYLSHVLAHLGPIPVRAVTRERMLAFRAKRLAEGASNRTCNLDVGTFQTCLRWALAEDMIGANPLAGLKQLPQSEAAQRKNRRPMTDDEIASFRKAARLDDDEGARRAAAERTIAAGSKGRAYASRERSGRIPQAPLWDTLLSSGIRWNEAATLRWGDIDPESRFLRVRADVAKSHKSREIPLPAELCAELLALHAMPPCSVRVLVRGRRCS